MSLYGAGALIIAALGAALAVSVKIVGGRKKRVGELEGALETARKEIRRLGEYYAKKEEAQRNADAKKETLHTGDSAADFDNSLKLLHGAAGGDTGSGPGA
jgi:hypothetical protein